MGEQTLYLYNPHEVQLAFHNSKARFKVAVLARQSGKSTMCNMELARRCWENPNTHYGFISPIFAQSKEQYRRQIRILPNEVILKKSETELRIDFVNGSYIEYLSGDNPDSLRGRTYHGVVIDEVRDQRSDIFSMVVRPMISTTKGWCAFVSTPNGYDVFYDLAEIARKNETGDWFLIHAPSTCNPMFTKEEIDSLKITMSEDEFAQEILAEFREFGRGKAYLSHGIHNQLITSPFTFDGSLVSPYLPVTIGLDFNVNPMSWHMGQFRGPISYWFDEIHIENTNTLLCAQELAGKLSALKEQGKLMCNPMVRLCGDATGESRNTKSTQSDYDIICSALDSAGITWTNDTPRSNPPVKQRVNTMNARMKSADGTVTLFYHPGKCPRLKKDFERVVWKQGAEHMLDQTTDKTLTHASDSVGYPVCVYSPVELYGSVGTLHAIHRGIG